MEPQTGSLLRHRLFLHASVDSGGACSVRMTSPFAGPVGWSAPELIRNACAKPHAETCHWGAGAKGKRPGWTERATRAVIFFEARRRRVDERVDTRAMGTWLEG